MAEETNRKLYGEKEVRALLRRATLLQAREDEGPGTGLSLDEVEQIAAETGIDPRYVRTAAAELALARPAPRKRSLLGGSTTIELARVVPGEAKEAQWEAMIHEIRRTFGQTGQNARLGAAFEWSNGPEPQLVEAQVTVSPRQGQTTVQVVRRSDGAVFLLYLVAGIVTLMGGMIFASMAGGAMGLPAIAAIIGAFAAAALAAVRAMTASSERKARRQMQQLLDQMEAILAPASARTHAPPALTADPTSPERLDLPEDPAPETATLRRRSRSGH